MASDTLECSKPPKGKGMGAVASPATESTRSSTGSSASGDCPKGQASPGPY